MQKQVVQIGTDCTAGRQSDIAILAFCGIPMHILLRIATDQKCGWCLSIPAVWGGASGRATCLLP